MEIPFFLICSFQKMHKNLGGLFREKLSAVG